MSIILNNIVGVGVLGMTALTAAFALWGPASISIDERAFLVTCALFAPSVGAIVLYILNQETR